MIRAIEIGKYYTENPQPENDFPQINSLVIGLKYDRQSQRKRITQRLKQRLDEGMIDEVKLLLLKGITAEDIIYYGLEYKYLTQYILGELSYSDMFTKLETAIHQFAKRQMTWFRKMERSGIQIYWLDGYASMQEKLERAIKLYEN